MAPADGGVAKSPAGGLTLSFVARAALVVLGIWALANIVWLGRDLLFVVFLAVMLSLFLSIFVDPLVRFGVPRAAAAVGVLLAALGPTSSRRWS